MGNLFSGRYYWNNKHGICMRQYEKVYNYIASRQAVNHSTSYEDIRKHFGWKSRSTAQNHIRVLIRKRWAEKKHYRQDTLGLILLDKKTH